MKKISAQIVADSINLQGNRITTFLLTYPRFIHGELMTHRMFSRNSASSRAISFEKMVKMVEEDPFIPIAWQKDHKGMQGSEYFTDEKEIQAKVNCWLNARNNAIRSAKYLNSELTIHKINGEEFVSYQQEDSDSLESLMADKRLANTKVTKQLCNRLLEPFQWYTCLVTSTEFDNFYELRCPKYYYEPENKYFKSKKDYSNYWFENFGSGIEEAIEGDPTIWWLKRSKSGAEIHIQALAEAMWDAQNKSTPKKLEYGMWHIPFGDKLVLNFKNNSDEFITADDLKFNNPELIKIATARCARLSYMTFDGEIDYEKDFKLHDQLLASEHMSPFEHCARAMSEEEYDSFIKGEVKLGLDTSTGGWGGPPNTTYHPSENTQGWCNNFRGFIQYRYLIEKNGR